MTNLLTKYGSFRRLTEAYWQAALTIEEEREMEGAMKKELLASFKPIVFPVDALCLVQKGETLCGLPRGHRGPHMPYDTDEQYRAKIMGIPQSQVRSGWGNGTV